MAFWRRDHKSKPPPDPQALVARREYDQAITAYRELLAAKPAHYLYHHKIADVFCLAGRPAEAFDDYMRAADGFARDGYLIKATAILKKMHKIRPDDAGVERRIKELSRLGSSVSVTAPPPAFGSGPEIAIDMEEIRDPAPIPVSAAAPSSGAGEENEGSSLAGTPLFSDFTAEELADVLRRLKHRSYAPGDLIVREGEPGESLFVLSQGRVKVVGTGPGGRAVELAELGEGDFFGEVALLTGRPRTATITSLDETEVLELTRGDLKDLEGRHARIRQVIEDFYEKRVESTVESMLDAVRLPEP
ncbi:MAG TPA: cyclic nucleotide-binding domain-containing protein [Candidatus Saccharimonadales bacterium]|nr:cyclic nucleotide-binding domain-containing protein [Candidatus Saccharimonadales bacterium]